MAIWSRAPASRAPDRSRGQSWSGSAAGSSDGDGMAFSGNSSGSRTRSAGKLMRQAIAMSVGS
jgi:hypothetical protein